MDVAGLFHRDEAGDQNVLLLFLDELFMLQYSLFFWMSFSLLQYSLS